MKRRYLANKKEGRQPRVTRKPKTSKRMRVLPKENRLNPALPAPAVTEEDMEMGLMSLIERGMVPPTLDLSNVMGSSPSPITAAPVKLKKYHKQFVKKPIMTQQEFPSALLTSIKLDLTPVNDSMRDIERKNDTQKAKIAYTTFGSQEKTIKEDAKTEVTEDDTISSIRPETTQSEPMSVIVNVVEPPKMGQQRREYEELMDEYSLHHLIIRKGKLLASTPEFVSYQRSYQLAWGPILSILQQLEKLFTQFEVPLVFIDGKRVAFLADQCEIRAPSIHDLLDTVVNQDKVLPYIQTPQTKYKGVNGAELAAIDIQRTWKMYVQRKRFLHLKQQDANALKIQRHWFLRVRFFETKRRIEHHLEDQYEKWQHRMKRFQKSWPRLANKKRMIVHINSLSASEQVRSSLPKFKLMEQSQLARILVDLQMPLNHVVFITPQPIGDEGKEYIINILESQGVKKVRQRLTILFPEYYDAFPEHTSLSRALFFSPHTLKYIKTLTLGEDAYIVPGIVGKEDLRVALKLQLPILGPNPTTGEIYQTKSGSRRIFLKADVSIPPGKTDIENEKELLIHLCRKIVNNPEYERWLIKLDHECEGRGTAYLDIREINCLSEEAREEMKEELNGNEEGMIDELQNRLYNELADGALKALLRFVSYVYTYETFMEALEKHGGLIEPVPSHVLGSPTVNLFIPPTGSTRIDSIQESLTSPEYSTLGAAYPQTTIPNEALAAASREIAAVCREKEIYGFVSIQFVSFLTADNALKIWAIDLNCHLTNEALQHHIASFMSNGPTKSLAVVAPPNCSYIYTGLIRHPEFSTW
eukprot:CAMPEP_0117432188 /NCGR_PEP_ID=MMETSP0758-20121206/11716_1 /TAXON_ID=63605 /ORGANISM="Percolomonas cosmopolitus, Strain AE-1 (ATCC 50343)" /LENGTH=812 /DNA_ID=CAMNT_0005221935 /DNA_START=20 /DNA_END=2455 /DNA_ORIENTATION=+